MLADQENGCCTASSCVAVVFGVTAGACCPRVLCCRCRGGLPLARLAAECCWRRLHARRIKSFSRAGVAAHPPRADAAPQVCAPCVRPKTECSRATCRRAKPTLLMCCACRAMHAISGNLQAAEATMQQMAQVQQQAMPDASSSPQHAGPSPQPLGSSFSARPAGSSIKSGHSQPATTVQRKGYSNKGGARTTPAGKAAAGRQGGNR